MSRSSGICARLSALEPSHSNRITRTKKMTNSQKAISNQKATRLKTHQRALETLSRKCTSVMRGRRIQEFIPSEPAPNLNRCAGWTRYLKPGRFLASRQFSKFRFPLESTSGSHSQPDPVLASFRLSIPQCLTNFSISCFYSRLTNLLAKWECTCLAKKIDNYYILPLL